MVDIKEITEEFTKLSSSDMGKVRFEENFDKKNHADEIETAEWICEKYGGDILLLCESKKQNEQMPDYLWRDRYWERKGIVSSKVNTVHQQKKRHTPRLMENGEVLFLIFQKEIWRGVTKK